MPDPGQSTLNWQVAPVASHILSHPGPWEARVLGDIGNDMEGESTQDSMAGETSAKPRRVNLVHQPSSGVMLLREPQVGGFTLTEEP